MLLTLAAGGTLRRLPLGLGLAAFIVAAATALPLGYLVMRALGGAEGVWSVLLAPRTGAVVRLTRIAAASQTLSD